MTFQIIIRGRNCAKYLEECIDSVILQTVRNWRITLILDAPEDKSMIIAYHMMQKCGGRMKIVCNKKRKGLCYNIWLGIREAKPTDEDIVGIVDADDSLYPHALEIVGREYDKHPEGLLTYGSYIKRSKGRKTKISKPYPSRAKVRKHKWRGSHFKTFKYKLYKHLPRLSHLQDDKGNWGQAASDLALMFSLMELAGLKRCRHISSPLYLWRDNYSGSTKKALQKKWEKIFRAKKPLKRVDV